jgi:hypothetical protein
MDEWNAIRFTAEKNKTLCILCGSLRLCGEVFLNFPALLYIGVAFEMIAIYRVYGIDA